jgi:hypothetical protein
VADFTDAFWKTWTREDDDCPTSKTWAGGSDAVGGKIKISLADMDLPRWEHELRLKT